MIRELQKKFVIVNMALVLLVLVAAFTVVCVSGYNRERQQSEDALGVALSRRDDQKPPQFNVGQRPPDDFSRSPVFVVTVFENGAVNVTQSDNVSVTQSDLTKIVALVKSGGETGFLREFNLRYMSKSERGALRIALIEVSGERAAVSNTVLMSAVALIVALALFLTVSLFLARWVFRPAQEAWRQQQRFVEDASHELKTPLTVILANIGILKSTRDATIEQSLGWIDNTEAEAVRMRELVENLLFLAKSDAVKTREKHTEQSLSDVAVGAALSFEAVAYERGVRLDTSGILPGVTVSGDASQLRQLLFVLIDNAVKYSKSPGVVRVSLTRRQSKAELRVRNDGETISPDELTHIFERFYRSDRARAGDGYGLGLAIAKNIAELHGGKITAESDGEHGTTFTVTLPAV